jgi:hypothetical protein
MFNGGGGITVLFKDHVVGVLAVEHIMHRESVIHEVVQIMASEQLLRKEAAN